VLDRETTPCELPLERAQELVAAAARRGSKLVEEGEVGAAGSRSGPVHFGPRPRRKPTTDTPRLTRTGARVHAYAAPFRFQTRNPGYASPTIS